MRIWFLRMLQFTDKKFVDPGGGGAGFNPSTLEAEAGGSLWVWGQPGIPRQALKLQKNPFFKNTQKICCKVLHDRSCYYRTGTTCELLWQLQIWRLFSQKCAFPSVWDMAPRYTDVFSLFCHCLRKPLLSLQMTCSLLQDCDLKACVT